MVERHITSSFDYKEHVASQKFPSACFTNTSKCSGNLDVCQWDWRNIDLGDLNTTTTLSWCFHTNYLMITIIIISMRTVRRPLIFSTPNIIVLNLQLTLTFFYLYANSNSSSISPITITIAARMLFFFIYCFFFFSASFFSSSLFLFFSLDFSCFLLLSSLAPPGAPQLAWLYPSLHRWKRLDTGNFPSNRGIEEAPRNLGKPF